MANPRLSDDPLATAAPHAPPESPSTVEPSPPAAPVPRRGRSLVRKLGVLASFVVVPAMLVLLWWGLTWLRVYPEAVLPSPIEVAKALWTWIAGPEGEGPNSGTAWEAIAASGKRVLVGYAIAATAGVTLGVLIGYFNVFARLFDPLVQLMRPIPVTAWVPLSLVFFGFGFRGAVFLVALGAFFPIVVNTTEGVRGANRILMRVGRMMGAGTFRLLRHFIIPASLPSIFVGLRLGIGVAWLLVVVAEMLSVKAGVGYTLLDAYSFGRYNVIIAAMIMLGVLGFLSDRIVVFVQRFVLRWHREMSIHGG